MTVKGSAGGVDPSIPVVTATIVDPNDAEGGFDNEALPSSSYAASAAAAVMSNSGSMPPACVPGNSSVVSRGNSMPPACVPGAQNAGSVKQASVVTQSTTGPQTTVTTTTTTSTFRPLDLGRSAIGFKCPFCQQEQVTTVRAAMDACSVLAVVLLLLFFWPLFWLPFCMPSCKTHEHYCGRCNRKVGESKACS